MESIFKKLGIGNENLIFMFEKKEAWKKNFIKLSSHVHLMTEHSWQKVRNGKWTYALTSFWQ